MNNATITLDSATASIFTNSIHIPDSILNAAVSVNSDSPEYCFKASNTHTEYGKESEKKAKEKPKQKHVYCEYRPKKIIQNGPCTIIFWEDDTKTIVRRSEGTDDDPYYAFCAALAKKVYGNNTKVKKLIEEKTVEPKKKEDFMTAYRKLREKGMNQSEIAKKMDIPLSTLRYKVSSMSKRKGDKK